MKRLIIDTSSDRLSILLMVDEKCKSYYEVDAGRRMSEMLLTSIDSVLFDASFAVSDIDEFYAVVGPGSFTGVRIGVAMTLGLSEGCGKEAYGLSSLDLCALASGKDDVDVCSRLKGDIFVTKHYDFKNKVYSDYECIVIKDEALDVYFIVNSGGSEYVDLNRAVKSGEFLDFRLKCEPLYFRQSEAELNFAAKSLAK